MFAYRTSDLLESVVQSYQKPDLKMFANSRGRFLDRYSSN